jgi:sulfite reductase (ferredoxin)
LTVEDVAQQLDGSSPQDILAWAIHTYRPRIVLACSFGGPTGIAALDMAMRLDAKLPLYYLDTGLLFPETHELVEKIRARYGTEPIRVTPALSLEQQGARYGEALWERDPDACCHMRKVAPQRAFLAGYDAWISGIRRDQSRTRQQTPVVQWDGEFGLVKVNPFAAWDEAAIWQYLRANGLEYNALHDRGFPSVGCTTCTRAIHPGEDVRAGRWPGFAKTECGLHGLTVLGAGEGSKNEAIKFQSDRLRGTIAAELATDAPNLTEDAAQLLKFHGSYQQENRDERKARKASGLDKAHQFMVRTRIPGGVLTAAAYKAHDELASRYGNATLRLTTRQGIQLHGVLKYDLKATIRAINDALLSTLAACGDVNRNVMACPAPAIDRADETLHESAYRLAMHLAPRTRAYHEIWLDGEKLEQLEREPESEPIYGPTYLPRKFKIAVAKGDDNCVDAFTQDIAFVAEFANDEVAGYTALIGGGMGSTHGKSETYPRLASPLCFVRPHELLEIAEAIVTIQRDFGDRKNRKHARMKYLVEERGVAWFRAELERRLERAVEDPHPVHFAHAHDHLGWHREAGGTWFLGIYVENGRVADRTTGLVRSGLRAVLDRFDLGVRITGQQNLLLTGIRAEDREAVEAILHDHGIETDPVTLGLRRGAMACPALPTCGLAVAEAERALPAVVAEMQVLLHDLGLDGEGISIRMTGCPNGCARPRMGDIGIVGRSAGTYDLFLGGDAAGTRLNALFATGVKSEAIVRTLEPELVRWKRERRDGEAFGEFSNRVGKETARSLDGSTARLVPSEHDDVLRFRDDHDHYDDDQRVAVR